MEVPKLATSGHAVEGGQQLPRAGGVSFPRIPATRRRCWKPRISGLCWLATSAPK